MIFQLLALAVAFVAVVASAWLLLRWGHIVDDDPYPDEDAGMRAARQRHPANRVTWTCHTCHEPLAGPMVEHICGDA